MTKKIYDIVPVPKPRMTRADKWKKRPATARYWAYKDEVKLRGVNVPVSGTHITFVMPMPTSWSKKKKAAHLGEAHQQKPDVDNLTKALLDAIYDDDAHIWDIRTTKIWGEVGRVIIEGID